MSQLIKRTKKTCLKLLQRISSSKQLYMQKLEEDDISTQNTAAAITKQNPKHYSSFTAHSNSNTYDALDLNCEHIKSTKQTRSTTDLEHEQQLETVLSTAEADSNNASLDNCTGEWLIEENGERNGNILDVAELRAETCVFEKVPFKENVRYFRHTPSTTSLDNYWAIEEESRNDCDNGNDPNDAGSIDIPKSKKKKSGRATIAVHLDCNGNSLDDNIFINENIENFNTKWFSLESKRLTVIKREVEGDSQQSSAHSSSTTLETWLDDCGGYESEDFLLKDMDRHYRSGLNAVVKSK